MDCKKPLFTYNSCFYYCSKMADWLYRTAYIFPLLSRECLYRISLQFVKKNTNEKRYKWFCILKGPILQRKSACFTVQKSLFYHVKQPLLQPIDNKVVAKKLLFCKIFTLVWECFSWQLGLLSCVLGVASMSLFYLFSIITKGVESPQPPSSLVLPLIILSFNNLYIVYFQSLSEVNPRRQS